MSRTVQLWIVAFVVTLGSAAWQRLSGPTHPLRVRTELAGATVKAKLLRTHVTSSGLPIAIAAPDASIIGAVNWRRHPTNERWTRLDLTRDGEMLRAQLPPQPPAGKVAYWVELERSARADAPAGLQPQSRGAARLRLPADGAVVARYKGPVPRAVLAPHIGLMFMGMLWSTRAGLSALVRSKRQRGHLIAALVLLALGGLLFGPLVQKAAFGAYWTGWPFGGDLTDNKTAVAVACWLVALWRSRGGRDARWWIIGAAVITLAIFIVPHSALGSEFDYERGVPGRAGP